MVLLQLKDLLELFVNRREFLPGYGFLYAFESDVKAHYVLPLLPSQAATGLAWSLYKCAALSMAVYGLSPT